MTAPEFDPIETAEAAARDWTRNYVGKRRANEDGTPMRLDDQTMADLVAARVAHWLGDREGHDTAEQAALLRLHTQLGDWVAVHRTIRLAEATIVARAHVQMDLLLLDQAQTIADMWSHCPDVPLHWRWDRQAGPTEASRMKVARGCCPWCGLPKPRGTR